MDIKVGELIGAFISIVIGLALTPAVSGYAKTIENDANSSEILVTIAPYVPVMWLLATMGIAAALVYSYFK